MMTLDDEEDYMDALRKIKGRYLDYDVEEAQKMCEQ